MANARSDTAFTKPAFRDPMRQRRCLIPADVFYEWQVIPGRSPKQPFAVALHDAEIFALGGIWDYWRPKEGGDGLVTCAILTTDPNTLLTPVHDRMPVIVRPERYSAWLDPRTPAPAVRDLMQPYPSEEMRAWPITRRVNKASEDDAGILVPADDA
jgi:putative SOS response-associated peptidase YedK